MQFAIAIPTDADSWRVVRRAEELGFARAWFYDTQMLSADPFVAMAAAAIKTTKIRLGTGVGVTQQTSARADRFWDRDRVHRTTGDGARRGQVGGFGGVLPRRD